MSFSVSMVSVAYPFSHIHVLKPAFPTWKLRSNIFNNRKIFIYSQRKIDIPQISHGQPGKQALSPDSTILHPAQSIVNRNSFSLFSCCFLKKNWKLGYFWAESFTQPLVSISQNNYYGTACKNIKKMLDFMYFTIFISH